MDSKNTQYKLPNRSQKPIKVEMDGDVTIVGHPCSMNLPSKIMTTIVVDYDSRDGSRTILVNGKPAIHVMFVSEDLESPDGYELVERIETEEGYEYGLYAQYTN